MLSILSQKNASVLALWTLFAYLHKHHIIVWFSKLCLTTQSRKWEEYNFVTQTRIFFEIKQKSKPLQSSSSSSSSKDNGNCRKWNIHAILQRKCQYTKRRPWHTFILHHKIRSLPLWYLSVSTIQNISPSQGH